MKYFKVRRTEKYLIIVSLFDSVFFAKLSEYSSFLSSIRFPNRIFLCYAVIVIDLDKNKYVTHRMYSFPTNLDLYSNKRISAPIYEKIRKQLEEGKLSIDVKLKYKFNSRTMDTYRPISKDRAENFDISGIIKDTLHMEIDDYIKHHSSMTDNGYYSFVDPYYNQRSITKEMMINDTPCTCTDKKRKLRYRCECDDKKNCDKYHVKKCLCGKFTYYRKYNCLHCQLKHSRSKSIKMLFSDVGQQKDVLRQGYSTTHTTMSSYIPYFHYNQNGGGLCLGNGSTAINNMIIDTINPVRVMLSFKANLSYTDADSTTNYYNNYSERIPRGDFDKHTEYIQYLSQVDTTPSKGIYKKKGISQHAFSLYCYCSQCLYYKILMFINKITLSERGFVKEQPYVVSRDQFIAKYTFFLERSKSNSYVDSYIHKIIKTVVNLSPKEMIKK